MKRHIPAHRLREAFDYDPHTGHFTWIGVNKHMLGKRAGSKSSRYRVVCVDGIRMFEHRAVWLWLYGVQPNGEIDHINRDGFDNRAENLREVTRSENCSNRGVFKNNTLGARGVRVESDGKFSARIQILGVRRRIGTFSSMEEAIQALSEARATSQQPE